MAPRTTATAGQPGGKRRGAGPTAAAAPTAAPPEVGGVRPWHLLVIGALMSAAAGALVTRDGGTVQTVAVIVTILTAGLVAAGLVRTLGPLVADDAGEETEMLAGRTRAALERERMLVLRSIKEVEFDRAMRKISDADYNEIVPRLRTRAVGLVRQLEGGGGYRGLIERDLAKLISATTPTLGEAQPQAAQRTYRQWTPEETLRARDSGERRNPTENSVIPAKAGIQPCTSVDPGSHPNAAAASGTPGFRRGDDSLIGSAEEGPLMFSDPAPPGSCPNCSTVNDTDARFCKSCGARLAGDV